MPRLAALHHCLLARIPETKVRRPLRRRQGALLDAVTAVLEHAGWRQISSSQDDTLESRSPRNPVRLRSPPRLSLCRWVWPLEAGMGATPARRAKQASERSRLGWDQAMISWAATIVRPLVRRAGPGRVRGGERGSRPRARRLRLLRPGRGGRGCAARAGQRARRVSSSLSGGGCSGRAACRAVVGATRGGGTRVR